MNVLTEAAQIIQEHADSLREGESIAGEFVGSDEIRAELDHMERVANLLRVAAITLGVE